MLEDDGNGFIYCPIVGYGPYDLSISEAMLADRNAIMGLGDGGAHVGFILDAGFPTWSARLLGQAAAAFRGSRADPPASPPTRPVPPGCSIAAASRSARRAISTFIDWDRIGFSAPYLAYDLPAGGKRLLQRGEGYEATIVSGQVTYREGSPTDALPGQLVRGQRAA